MSGSVYSLWDYGGSGKVEEGPRDGDLYELFCNKLAEMAGDLSALANALRTGQRDHQTLKPARTAAHRMHGAGSMYGHPCVSQLGAALEQLLPAIEAGQIAVTDAASTLLDDCADALRHFDHAEHRGAATPQAISRLAWQCECAARGGSTDGPASPTDP